MYVYTCIFKYIQTYWQQQIVYIYTVNIYNVDFIITVLLFMDYFLLQFLSEDLHLDKTNPAIGSVPTDRQDRRAKSGGDFYADQKRESVRNMARHGVARKNINKKTARKLDISR